MVTGRRLCQPLVKQAGGFIVTVAARQHDRAPDDGVDPVGRGRHLASKRGGRRDVERVDDERTRKRRVGVGPLTLSIQDRPERVPRVRGTDAGVNLRTHL